MMGSIISSAYLLAALLGAAGAAGPDASAQPLFAPGEKLYYKGYVLGWFPVGDAWFEVKMDTLRGKPVYRFDARALGHYVIYTLDIRLSSFVDPLSLRSLLFRRRQVGTEKREYEVIFDRERLAATYRRRCGKFQTVEELDAAPWKADPPFPINRDVNDILYTLYFARDIGDKVGNKKYYYLIEKNYIWKTFVEVIDERALDLGKLGKFDALRIAIQPDYSGEEETAEKFAGLFGVEGSLVVWVDKKTRIPLIVKGRVPFVSFLRPTVSVVLQDYHLPESGPSSGSPPRQRRDMPRMKP